MVEKFPLANGSWSTAANWNGGTLPQPGDDVFANNKFVTVNQSITVQSLNSTAGATAVAGGRFDFGNGITINANIVAGTSNCAQCNTTAGGSAFVNGNVTGSVTTTNIRGINFAAAAGTLTVTGTVRGGSVGTAHGIFLSGGGTLNVIGQCIGGDTAHGVNLTTTGTFNITGNCMGGVTGAGAGFVTAATATGPATINGDCVSGGTSGNRGALIQGSGAIVVNGSCIGGESNGLSNTGSSSTLVTGNATGGSGANINTGAGLAYTGTGQVTIQGLAVGASTGAGIAPGVHSNGTLPVIIGGAKYSSLGTSPVNGRAVRATLVGAVLEVRDSFLAPITLS